MPQDIVLGWCGHHVFLGDSLYLLRQFPEGVFDAVIMDPPYASGGLSFEARTQPTSAKYTDNKTDNPLPDFLGDKRDQRSYTSWLAEVLRECWRVLKSGGVVLCFCDWRQYPVVSDALQWADLLWRGVVVWDKSEGVRPQLGRFRSQAEFVLWASKDDLPLERGVGVLPGVYRVTTMTQNKLHQTEKPLELMRRLCRIVVPGGLVLDPFCGSGTTVVAAKQMGYSAVGIELSGYYVGVACRRVAEAVQQTALFEKAEIIKEDSVPF